MIKKVVCIVVLWFFQMSFVLAESNFRERLGNFNKDRSICQRLIAHGRSSVCVMLKKVDSEIKGFKQVKYPSSEEEPMANAYYKNEKLSVLELADAAILSDTITHYYLLDNDYIYITAIQTPHPQKLAQQFPDSNETYSKTPIITVYLVKGNDLVDSSSFCGTKHLDFVKSQFDDVMNDYHQFLTRNIQ